MVLIHTDKMRLSHLTLSLMFARYVGSLTQSLDSLVVTSVRFTRGWVIAIITSKESGKNEKTRDLLWREQSKFIINSTVPIRESIEGSWVI